MSIFWGGIQVGLLCAAALGYGGLAAPCLEKGRTPCENFVSRFALGLGLLILVTASGGWLRLWGPWFHHGIICGGIILLMAQRPRAAHPIRPLFHQRHLLWAAPALLLLLFYAAFPPIGEVG